MPTETEPEAPQPDPALYQLAFQESLRNLAAQAGVLDNLRTRAGLLITAANVVTALLGAPAIKAATDASTSVGIGVPLALICFAVVGVTSILLLWPWPRWNFRFDTREIVKHVEDHPDMTLARVHRRLAELNEDSYEQNEVRLGRLFKLLEAAAVFLFLEAGLWVMTLAHVQVGSVVF